MSLFKNKIITLSALTCCALALQGSRISANNPNIYLAATQESPGSVCAHLQMEHSNIAPNHPLSRQVHIPSGATAHYITAKDPAGNTIGVAAVVSSPRSPNMSGLQVFVDQKYQRQGCGTQLMQEAKSYAQQQGKSLCTNSKLWKNQAARAAAVKAQTMGISTCKM
jgi:GNAT superfamily N-acetyltransferase